MDRNELPDFLHFCILHNDRVSGEFCRYLGKVAKCMCTDTINLKEDGISVVKIINNNCKCVVKFLYPVPRVVALDGICHWKCSNNVCSK